MAVNTGPRAIHLVVDSAAFIERARLETFGSYFHTTQSVLDEIRDKHTKAFINALPYSLSIDIPTPESIKWVKELAKKTGDYFVLSKADIEVIALTYQFFKEVTGTDPVIKSAKIPTFSSQLFRFKKPPKFENRAKPLKNDDCFEADEAIDKLSHHLKETFQERNAASDIGITIDEDEFLDSDDESEAEPKVEEWITADNFDQKLQEGLGFGETRQNDELDIPENASPVPVACLTKDFAMQNVMMNAGIALLALSGKIIKRARTHVLWCGSCYAHTTKQDSYFCRMCGYPSLRRIPVTLHEDGQLEFHFSRKFQKNLRGTKHPVIVPKGGKHSDDPIYRADQRLPDRRAPKPKNPNVLPMGATNGLLYNDDSDDDVTDFLIDSAVGASDELAPVVFPTHDVNSIAAIRGLRSDGQIMPAPWERNGIEHGLKPTRYRANRPGRRRTGGKRNKLTK